MKRIVLLILLTLFSTESYAFFPDYIKNAAVDYFSKSEMLLEFESKLPAAAREIDTNVIQTNWSVNRKGILLVTKSYQLGMGAITSIAATIPYIMYDTLLPEQVNYRFYLPNRVELLGAVPPR